MAKKGLGKGLSALIPGLSGGSGKDPKEEALEAVSPVVLSGDQEKLVEIPLELISPNPLQPRKVFDQETLADLVASIKEFGIVQPILVRPAAPGRYELVAGERRWRAAKEAGLNTIRAIVDAVNDRDSLQIALIENLQRENLNAIEEAEAYRQLLSEFDITQAELAAHLGKSRSGITNALRLLTLPDEIKEAVSKAKLSAGHARALLAIPDQKTQLELAGKIMDGGLSVRDIEGMVGDRKTKSTPNGDPAAGVKPRDDRFTQVNDMLSTNMGFNVRIREKSGRGSVVIAFSGREELNTLIQLLAALRQKSNV